LRRWKNCNKSTSNSDRWKRNSGFRDSRRTRCYSPLFCLWTSPN